MSRDPSPANSQDPHLAGDPGQDPQDRALDAIDQTREHGEELPLSEMKFFELADHSTVGIVILSGSRFLYANRAAAQIGGYDVEEIMTWTPGNLLHVLHPADLQLVMTNMRRRLAGEADLPRAYDLRILTASGQTRHVSVSVSRWEQEGVPLIAVSLVDITDRMQMQTTLALADRMTSMGMLAAGVAHEINNPLTYVLYNLENLARNLPGLVDAVSLLRQRIAELQGEEEAAKVTAGLGTRPPLTDLEELVRQSQEALTGARRVRDIVRDLRVFSHVGEDRCVPVSLNQTVETAINMAFNEIKYRAKLVKDYGRVPLILANEGRLAQVFLNLLVNAAQAIEEGDAEHHTIRVRTWSEGEEVLVEVSDTGVGIPAEDLGRLFDPFFTTKPVGVGSGLGLCICQKIVSGYGGRIEVHSRKGEGSQFVVHMPVKSEKHVSLDVWPTIDQPVRPAGEQGRVLVVDDEKLVRTTVRRLLRSEHEVVLASSGEEAREILQADQDFDVILCDLIMPRVSGKELFAWVVSHTPHLVERMIFMTGGAFTPSAGEFLKQVKTLHLDKPFDPDNLRALVRDRVRLVRK